MNAKSLTPSKLRLILAAALVLIAAAGGVIFYLAYQRLSETASEVGVQVATSQESQNTIQRLEVLQRELDSHSDIMEKALQITANSQDYAYQDMIVNDLTIYANRANLGISVISFSAQPAQSTPAPTAPAAGNESMDITTPEGAGGATPTPNAAPAAGSNLRKATVDITLENPVNYRDLLNFLHYIETNLTKMKVSKVTLTKSDADSVTTDVLNLEVYLR